MLLVYFVTLVRLKIQDTFHVKTPWVAEELDPRVSLDVKIKHTEQYIRIIRRSIKLSHLQREPHQGD